MLSYDMRWSIVGDRYGVYSDTAWSAHVLVIWHISDKDMPFYKAQGEWPCHCKTNGWPVQLIEGREQACAHAYALI